MQRSVAGFAGALALLAWSGPVQSDADPPADQLPHFAKNGALEPPQGWEAWVMVGSSTGLSYNDGGARDNVFTQFYPPLRERLAKAVTVTR